jgi:hypothetical protein
MRRWTAAGWGGGAGLKADGFPVLDMSEAASVQDFDTAHGVGFLFSRVSFTCTRTRLSSACKLSLFERFFILAAPLLFFFTLKVLGEPAAALMRPHGAGPQAAGHLSGKAHRRPALAFHPSAVSH